jgi:hypothetical protein
LIIVDRSRSEIIGVDQSLSIRVDWSRSESIRVDRVCQELVRVSQSRSESVRVDQVSIKARLFCINCVEYTIAMVKTIPPQSQPNKKDQKKAFDLLLLECIQSKLHSSSTISRPIIILLAAYYRFTCGLLSLP